MGKEGEAFPSDTGIVGPSSICDVSGTSTTKFRTAPSAICKVKVPVYLIGTNWGIGVSFHAAWSVWNEPATLEKSGEGKDREENGTGSITCTLRVDLGILESKIEAFQGRTHLITTNPTDSVVVWRISLGVKGIYWDQLSSGT
jgi:hypothetical protein